MLMKWKGENSITIRYKNAV